MKELLSNLILTGKDAENFIKRMEYDENHPISAAEYEKMKRDYEIITGIKQ